MKAKIDTGKPKKMEEIDLMRERYARGRDACREAYDKCRDDIKFVAVPGNQWDDGLRRRRRNRPMYEFPKLQPHCQQVINEQKQTRPQGKIRGVGPDDKGLAEIMQGLCRNIESVSHADEAYDCAFVPAVQGGFGAWRICADYSGDDSFDQELFIEPIANPLAVTFDPAAIKRDRRDGNWAFVEELMPLTDFERRFPDADTTDFESDRDLVSWHERGQIKVAEYWEKNPKKRDLWALSDGEVIYADTLSDPDHQNAKRYLNAMAMSGVQADKVGVQELAQIGIHVLKSRIVDGHTVQMRLTNGREFLGDTHEFKSKFIPIVPVYGNIQNIDGVDYWCGMVRFNKDLQRLHNVHRSAIVEAVAKSPKAPFVLRPKTITGFEGYWNKANAEDYPYLPIQDETAIGEEPKRSEQAQIPAALIQLANMDNEDIKASTGQFNPSLGAQSNEVSGTAINARKLQSATATFNYIDGLTMAIRFSYEILMDAIPNYYDTPRVVRVLGDDGAAKWKQLYKEVTDPQTGQTHTLNDIGKGKYDVVVTVGPAFATQRMEAVESFTSLAGNIGRSDPMMGSLLAYQIAKNLDLPGSEDIATAMRGMLVSKGIIPRGPDDPEPKQQPPDPRVVAAVNKIGAEIAKIKAETRKTTTETVLMPKESEAQAISQIGLAMANFAKAKGTTVQAMLDAGDVHKMLLYDSDQFSGIDPLATPDNPHYVPPPDPMQQDTNQQPVQSA